MNLFRKLSLILLLPIFVANLSAADKLLVSGCGNRDIRVIDKKSQTVEWKHLIGVGEDCNAVQMTSKGEVLYAYKNGARLISYKDQHVVWDFKTLPGEEVFSSIELKNKNYLIAACGNPARIIELNEKGDSVHVLRFDTGIKHVHNQFRQVIQTSKGTYLLGLFNTGQLIELNRSGKELKRIAVGGTPFSVKELKNGNWLVACGDGHALKEVDSNTGKIISVFDNTVFTDSKLLFVGESYRLDNGNTLITNWEGHTKDSTQYKIMEVNKENKIVWGIKDGKVANHISALFLFKK